MVSAAFKCPQTTGTKFAFCLYHSSMVCTHVVASVRFACAEFHLHFRNNIHCEDDLLGLVTVEKFQYLARILSLMKYEKYDISLSNHRRTHFVKKNKEQDTVVHKNNVCTNFISSYDFVPTVKLK